MPMEMTRRGIAIGVVGRYRYSNPPLSAPMTPPSLRSSLRPLRGYRMDGMLFAVPMAKIPPHTRYSGEQD